MCDPADDLDDLDTPMCDGCVVWADRLCKLVDGTLWMSRLADHSDFVIGNADDLEGPVAVRPQSDSDFTSIENIDGVLLLRAECYYVLRGESVNDFTLHPLTRLVITHDADGKRRIRLPEELRVPREAALVSEGLGCSSHLVDRMQREAVEAGFSGVEFKRDPTSPYFYHVHYSDHGQREAYERFRGVVNHSGQSGGGANITADDLARAEQRVSEIYGQA